MRKLSIKALTVLILMIITVIIGVNYDRVNETINIRELSYNDISYKFENKDFTSHVIDDKILDNLHSVKINLFFRNDGYKKHDNIFATDLVNDGIRAEFSSDSNLTILANDDSGNLLGVPINKVLEIGREYQLAIEYQNNKMLVFLDGTPIVNSFDNLTPSFRKLIVGRGFDDARIFNGEIRDFNITYEFIDGDFDYTFYVILLMVILLFWSLLKIAIKNISNNILIFLLTIIALMIVAINYNRINEAINLREISFNNISYNYMKKDFTSHVIDDQNLDKLHSVKINLFFRNDGYKKHDNIFATDLFNDGIRAEFSSDSNLTILANDDSGNLLGVPINKVLEIGREYQLSIEYQNNKMLVFLDGSPVVNSFENLNPSFRNLSIGRGFNDERLFNGVIRGFNITYSIFDSHFDYSFCLLISLVVLLGWMIVRIKKKNSLLYLSANNIILLSVFIITLLLFGMFMMNALSNFAIYKKLVSPDLQLSTSRALFFLKNEFKREWVTRTAPRPLKDTESQLITIHLSIDRNDINMLNSNLKWSGRPDETVKAFMRTSDDNIVRKVEVRYRGEGNFHWLYKQKSLRIKLNKKETPYNMERKFNLINPPYVYSFRDVANYKIARDIGLIAPDYFPVRLVLNGEYMGVYMYLSQVDESLIRKHKIMPGSIYYGDSGAAPINSLGTTDMWFDEQYWVKKAARNAEQKNNRDDIRLFVNAIKNYDEKHFYDFVNMTLDKEKFLKFIALDRITGSSHHDYNHNHKIYFDPYKGKIEPIEWDLRFWKAPAGGEKDPSMYPLVKRIKFNPILDFEVDQVVYDLYKNNIIEDMNKIYLSSLDMARSDLSADKYRDSASDVTNIFNSTNGFWYSTPFTMAELDQTVAEDMEILSERKEQLDKIFDDVSLSYSVENSNGHFCRLIYYVNGNSPVSIDFSEISSGANVFKIIAGDKVPSGKIELLYPGRKIEVNNHSVVERSNEKVSNAVEKYVFLIEGGQDFQCETLQNITYVNAITGKSVFPEIGESSSPLATSIHPWDLLRENRINKVVLSGTVDLAKTLVFDRATTVNVRPGTTFVMHPGVSVYFYGKVNMEGVKDNPIKFVAKNEKEPWGVVTVQGEFASGSKFNFVNFENGSVDARDLITYTAPFNIHDVADFEVKNCTFGKNHIGDDSAHIAYSKGIVDHCLFENARSDALDIDIADVVISNNVFVNSGNDGLDLMTTKADIFSNIFLETGDKGISVGEWSDVVVKDSLFMNNEIGLEIKDKSHAKANNLIFVDDKSKAINLYNKNKRYDEGGNIEAENLLFLGNKTVKADKKSFALYKDEVSSLVIDENGWIAGFKDSQYYPLIESGLARYLPTYQVIPFSSL